MLAEHGAEPVLGRQAEGLRLACPALEQLLGVVGALLVLPGVVGGVLEDPGVLAPGEGSPEAGLGLGHSSRSLGFDGLAPGREVLDQGPGHARDVGLAVGARRLPGHPEPCAQLGPRAAW